MPNSDSAPSSVNCCPGTNRMVPSNPLALPTRPISTNRLGNCCSITGSYTPYFSDSDCLASHALCTVTLSSASVTNPSSSSRGLFLICSIASLAVISVEVPVLFSASSSAGASSAVSASAAGSSSATGSSATGSSAGSSAAGSSSATRSSAAASSSATGSSATGSSAVSSSAAGSSASTSSPSAAAAFSSAAFFSSASFASAAAFSSACFLNFSSSAFKSAFCRSLRLVSVSPALDSRASLHSCSAASISSSDLPHRIKCIL